MLEWRVVWGTELIFRFWFPDPLRFLGDQRWSNVRKHIEVMGQLAPALIGYTLIYNDI